jgi:hypothetical protein
MCSVSKAQDTTVFVHILHQGESFRNDSATAYYVLNRFTLEKAIVAKQTLDSLKLRFVETKKEEIESKEDGLEKNKWLIIGASVIVLFIVSLF